MLNLVNVNNPKEKRLSIVFREEGSSYHRHNILTNEYINPGEWHSADAKVTKCHYRGEVGSEVDFDN